MSTMTKATLLSGLALVLAGCGAGIAEDGLGTREQVSADLLVDGVGEVSDAKCNVVLRSLARVTDPYANPCYTGKCWAVFQGSLDLSEAAVAEASWVGVQYRSSVDNYAMWREVEASPVDGAPAGMQRYQFQMSEYTLDPGMGGTAISRTRLEVAALFRTAGGGRMWDHNRVPGAFDNYVLDLGNSWAIADDAAVCYPVAARSEVEFKAGWTIQQHAALVAGGSLLVRYAPSRLTACRSTHNGYAGFSIGGTVRFSPGGETADLGQLSFTGPTGQPTLDPTWMPFEVRIPAGATSAEMWFRNADVSGCEVWDSNFGQNYRFEVLRRAPAKPIWAGNWGNGFNRECQHVDGLSDPKVLGSWEQQRACLFVDAEVYVPGLTDAMERPERVAAQVVYQVDGGEERIAWLTYAGRAGNNYRYRWDLSREEMNRYYWNAYAFTFRFSTDGTSWVKTGTADAPYGGEARTLTRDSSWCGAGWPGCP